jgi:hypothetical protein
MECFRRASVVPDQVPAGMLAESGHREMRLKTKNRNPAKPNSGQTLVEVVGIEPATF